MPDGATGAELLGRLAADHPVVVRHWPAIRLAISLRYTQLKTVLRAGHEVTLTTPVRGGWHASS